MAKQSKFFKGNFFAMTSDEMRKSIDKYNPIMKSGYRKIPQPAVETKEVKGKKYSRFYTKPVGYGELD